MTKIARPKLALFSAIGRRAVFKQLDLVPGRLHDRDQNLRAGNAGDLFGQLAFLMSAVRELEAENITPEGERPLDIRDRDAGVIGGNNAKCHWAENVERPTPNVQL